MSRRSSESEDEKDEKRQKYRKESSEREEEEEKSLRKKSTSKSYRSKRESSPRRTKRRSKYDDSQSRSRSRSSSCSPALDNNQKHKEPGNRDAPEPSRCLGVFGLSSYTDEKDIKSVFGEYGEVDKIHLVKDRDYGNSKGFGFVYFKTVEEAEEARNKTQGLELDNRPIRVDFSLTTKPHPPTPGKYLGKASHESRRRFDRNDTRRGGYSSYRNHYSDRGYDGGYRNRESRGGYERRDYGRREYERRPSYRLSYDEEYYDDYEEESYSRRPRSYSSYPSSSSRYY